MSDWWLAVLMGAGAGMASVCLLAVLIGTRRLRVPAGCAAVIMGRGGRRVAFRSRLLLPGQQAVEVNLGPHRFDVSLRGDGAVRTKDGARVDVFARVQVSIARRAEDVLRIVGLLGGSRASDAEVVRDLLVVRVEAALHEVASTFQGEEIFARASDFRAQVSSHILPGLRGYTLDDLALSTFQKLPLR